METRVSLTPVVADYVFSFYVRNYEVLGVGTGRATIRNESDAYISKPRLAFIPVPIQVQPIIHGAITSSQFVRWSEDFLYIFFVIVDKPRLPLDNAGEVAVTQVPKTLHVAPHPLCTDDG